MGGPACHQEAAKTLSEGSVYKANQNSSFPQGLGLSYAKALVESGSDCLVLTSRSAALQKEELEMLARKDAAVFVLQADTASDQTSR